MPQSNDLSRSLAALDQDSTLIVVIEMSQSSWLVAGIIPGINRQPLKKLAAAETALLGLLHRWRDEATKAGRTVSRIVVAFAAGRDGFWLARWLRTRGIEADVIHATSVAVSREHRRAKTDRLDTELLKRAFLGGRRGERGHCSMAAIPTLEEEDAKRPNREREGLVGERTRIVNRIKSTLARLGIRGFKPTLRRAPERLAALLTPEGTPLPQNTLAEHAGRTRWPRCAATWRACASLSARSERSKPRAWNGSSSTPNKAPTRWSGGWHKSSALVSRQRTCWCTRSCRVTCATAEPWRVMPG